MSWHQEPNPADWIAAWKARFPGVPPPRTYRKGKLTAFVGREPVVEGDWRWHISLSGEGRVPTWAELAAAAHELRPGITFVIGIPPKSWWMNVHPNVLHLWELHDEHLIAEWRRSAMGHEPT